jgi:hypothetical protein
MTARPTVLPVGVILAEGMAARSAGDARRCASSEGASIGESTPAAAAQAVLFPTDEGFDFPPRYWRARRMAMRLWVAQELRDVHPRTETEALILAEHFAHRSLQRITTYGEGALLRSCVRDWFVARAAMARAAV